MYGHTHTHTQMRKFKNIHLHTMWIPLNNNHPHFITTENKSSPLRNTPFLEKKTGIHETLIRPSKSDFLNTKKGNLHSKKKTLCQKIRFST